MPTLDEITLAEAFSGVAQADPECAMAYMALLALGVGADTDRPELARAKQAIEP